MKVHRLEAHVTCLDTVPFEAPPAFVRLLDPSRQADADQQFETLWAYLHQYVSEALVAQAQQRTRVVDVTIVLEEVP
jgi:hypothetical protein